MSEFAHKPVLVSDVVELMDPQPGDTVVDATLGLGGHAEALMTRLGGLGKLIGIDKDADALSIARNRFKSNPENKDRFIPIQGDFRCIDDLVRGAGFENVDRILFDLGVSSLQLDKPERGFSFKYDAPLDMRMDTGQEMTAADILRDYSEAELAEVLMSLGEERRSSIIAKRIVEARVKQPITTTKQLVGLVGGKMGRIHPATKVFQALRMEVNDELGAIREALPRAIQLIAPGGRLAVITFHSLEDRLVKQLFKSWEAQGDVRLVNKKVVQAKWTEKQQNPRARSAKLRVVEKI